VTITPELAGTVREINFESGAVVTKGDLLVKLDTSSEEASFVHLKPRFNGPKSASTVKPLLEPIKSVHSRIFDFGRSAWKQSVANADGTGAIIEKKTLRAPFAGQLGLRQVNLGQYLDAGKTIVSLQSLTPVYTDFSCPNRNWDISNLA